MKSGAITRIIIFSITILLLGGVLIAGLAANGFVRNRAAEIADNGAQEHIGSIYRASSAVTDIEIEWASGNITIIPGDVDQILVEDPCATEKCKMVVQERSDSLHIQYCEDSTGFIGFGVSISVNKDLYITVPRQWSGEEISIKAASANVSIQDLNLQELEFDGASGECTLENCSIGDLDIDTASGDVRFSGSLNTLDFDAASANFWADLVNIPHQLDMDSASGDLELILPQNAGFAVNVDAMSSDFYSDFETVIKNGSYVCGNGQCRIDVDCMNGDVTIRKCTNPEHSGCIA